MILSLLAVLFFHPVRADYLDHIFLLEPEITWAIDEGGPADLRAQCAQMKYNYLEETAKLSELKRQLHRAVQSPLTDSQIVTIELLKRQILEATRRLIHLAKAEWNSENISFRVRWWLPEQLDRQTVKISSFKINASYFKGHLTEPPGLELINFELMWFPGLTPYRGSLYYLDFNGRGSFLEVCQHLQTLEFEVEAKVSWLFLLGTKPVSQDLFLRGRAP